VADYESYSQDTDLVFYPLVTGLTRPATFKGAHLSFVAVSAMIVFLGFMFLEDLRFLLLYGVLHAIGYALQVWDPRFVDIVLMKARKGWSVKNISFWGGNSYSPSLKPSVRA
jgi:type IV secretory pathway VirB3-like protein